MSLKIKRSILWWLSLLLFHFAHAQGSSTPSVPPPGTPPAGPATDSLLAGLAAAPAPPPDSVAALHRLFARRRHNGHVSLGVGGGLLAASGIAVAIGANTGGSAGLAPFVFGILGGVFVTPIAVRGAVLSLTYTEGRERRLVQAWQQHRLPRHVRRKLRPEYFEPASVRPR